MTGDIETPISEKDAIKAGLASLKDCKAEDDSDFSKGLRAMRQLIKAHAEKRVKHE
jgi:hypothetical protein